METPKDCTKCKHPDGCCTYYGGSLCKHTKEINRAAIDAVLSAKEQPDPTAPGSPGAWK